MENQQPLLDANIPESNVTEEQKPFDQLVTDFEAGVVKPRKVDDRVTEILKNVNRENLTAMENAQTGLANFLDKVGVKNDGTSETIELRKKQKKELHEMKAEFDAEIENAKDEFAQECEREEKEYALLQTESNAMIQMDEKVSHIANQPTTPQENVSDNTDENATIQLEEIAIDEEEEEEMEIPEEIQAETKKIVQTQEMENELSDGLLQLRKNGQGFLAKPENIALLHDLGISKIPTDDFGARGGLQAIHDLQAALNSKLNTGLVEDGIFGNKTKNAIKTYKIAINPNAEGPYQYIGDNTAPAEKTESWKIFGEQPLPGPVIENGATAQPAEVANNDISVASNSENLKKLGIAIDAQDWDDVKNIPKADLRAVFKLKEGWRTWVNRNLSGSSVDTATFLGTGNETGLPISENIDRIKTSVNLGPIDIRRFSNWVNSPKGDAFLSSNAKNLGEYVKTLAGTDKQNTSTPAANKVPVSENTASETPEEKSADNLKKLGIAIDAHDWKDVKDIPSADLKAAFKLKEGWRTWVNRNLSGSSVDTATFLGTGNEKTGREDSDRIKTSVNLGPIDIRRFGNWVNSPKGEAFLNSNANTLEEYVKTLT